MDVQTGITASNQRAYREVNEQIRAGAERFLMASEDLAVFLCECGDDACAEAVYLTLAEYAAVRSRRRRFAVFPGHEGLERRVAANERFSVVEARVSAAA